MTSQQSLYFRITMYVLCLTGVAVSGVSGIKELCSEACTAAHTFTFYRLPMQAVGVAYFAALLVVALVMDKSAKTAWLRRVFTIMVAMGIGAETWFIGIQIFQIGRMCILCAIVACVMAVIALFWGGICWKPMMNTIRGGSRMNMFGRLVGKGAVVLTALVAGLLVSFAGLRPTNAAGEKLNPYIGSQMSQVEVIFITDWFCPSCIKAEPAMEEIVTKLNNKAKFAFIELNIHEDSYNFVPANLSFLINEKRNYLQLRQALHGLAKKTATPTEEDLRNLARPYGVVYKPLPMTAVIKGMQFASGIVATAGINSTPTVLVINRKSGANTILQGDKSITLEAVSRAIDALVHS